MRSLRESVKGPEMHSVLQEGRIRGRCGAVRHPCGAPCVSPQNVAIKAPLALHGARCAATESRLLTAACEEGGERGEACVELTIRRNMRGKGSPRAGGSSCRWAHRRI